MGHRSNYNGSMILLISLLTSLSFASIVQDDVSITEKHSYSFKEVCEKMLKFEAPLIEVVSGTTLDCMSKKVEVSDFCDKELVQDPYYLRGYVDREKKLVHCQSGKKVIFRYQCVKLADKELCSKEPKAACEFIKHKLARRLDLVEHSFSKNPKGIKELSCKFESLPLKKNHGSL